MIKDLHIQDFIAHKDTKLEFGRGITVFVGHNGSGKSSVIDAITFALFGQHTRRSSKNLVRRGARQGTVQLHFSANSREYVATRIVGGPDPRSQLLLVAEGNATGMPIVGGERRQFGESMSSEVAKVLGLDYDRMCVAALVQQGELLRIVNYAPKDFKEMLNGLIGIEKLDTAYNTMKDVIGGFRERLRVETGYTDEEIPRVEALISEKKSESNRAKAVLADFEDERTLLEKRIAQLETQVAMMEPGMQKAHDLASRERMLVKHVSEKKSSMQSDIARMERVVAEAARYLQLLGEKDEVSVRLEMVRAESEELQQKIEETEGMRGKLRGLLECASRLKIVDGKCPACNSPVSRLNTFFDTEHILREIKSREEEKAQLQKTRLELKKEELQLGEKADKITYAERFLRDNSLSSESDLRRTEAELQSKKDGLARLPSEITGVGPQASLFAIDGVSKSLVEEVILLRSQVSSFSQHDYTNAKLERDNLSRKLQHANRRIGIYEKTLADATQAIESAEKALVELRNALEFVRMLDKIRANVFNRDGPIATSLRSWAIKIISKKASDYASLFNIGISRIELAEKPREILITCYGRHGEIDLDSLSGGEKVAAALALRLGIAYMMGSNRLDFVILDEPTTHLDEERRKALVRIMSEAFRDGTGPLSQLIIITHDSEIFEDSEVDKIFRFSMTADGSRVVPE